MIEPDVLQDYTKRALRLGPPHGPECPCYMDAVIRLGIGHRPLIQTEPMRFRETITESRELRSRHSAAGRLQMDPGEYDRQRDAGNLWCTDHGWQPADEFYAKSPSVSRCREAHRVYMRARYYARRQAS